MMGSDKVSRVVQKVVGEEEGGVWNGWSECRENKRRGWEMNQIKIKS